MGERRGSGRTRNALARRTKGTVRGTSPKNMYVIISSVSGIYILFCVWPTPINAKISARTLVNRNVWSFFTVTPTAAIRRP